MPFMVYIFLLFWFNVMWFVTYALVIRRSYLDKSAGIPMVALALNLAWDISGAFIIQSPGLQATINIAYVIINLMITAQWLRYWKHDFKQLSGFEFYILFVTTQIFAFVIILVGQRELKDVLLFKMGFIDNFINSALFIAMLYRRPALEGQSLYIGLSKLIGTGSVSIASIYYPYPGLENSIALPYLFAGIFILDTLYIVFYFKKARSLGVNPFRRW